MIKLKKQMMFGAMMYLTSLCLYVWSTKFYPVQLSFAQNQVISGIMFFNLLSTVYLVALISRSSVCSDDLYLEDAFDPGSHENHPGLTFFFGEERQLKLRTSFIAKERITHAAIRRPRGVLYVVSRPGTHDALADFMRCRADCYEDMTNEVHGFITNRGRFVDRYHAWDIAVASGQIHVKNKKHWHNGSLQMNHLYK